MLDHQSGEIFESEDAGIYYEVVGPSLGHPLLLLHGGLGSLADFSAIINAIPDSFRVIAVDLRGHGRSTLGSKPLTYQQHQLDIQALINHLGFSQYTLLGFSDGGIVAYRIASNNPAINALITVGARWRISRQDPSFGILSGVTPAIWAEMFPDAPAKFAALNPKGDFNKLVQSCVDLWTDFGQTGYPGESITHIGCPTLIIRGDGDFLLSLSDAVEARSKIPGSSFGNIPFSSHAALEDAPKVCGEIIHDFLKKPRKARDKA